ncbi:probable serine/threonine-protein kinase DDB_G0281745 [Hyalella azteca]|uniref:Tyrosine-protein kinase n=1 Tax=Hyalella azteca TaxID=294128 RepID=A0A8B7N7C5_HYAAZ|nr:probable serine/threonine-protein kinase DDB_G0281745 [Hyalella azteca]
MGSTELKEDCKARAVLSWIKKNEQELSISLGDIVKIHSINQDKKWVLCETKHCERGYVPYSHLTPIQDYRPESVERLISNQANKQEGWNSVIQNLVELQKLNLHRTAPRAVQHQSLQQCPAQAKPNNPDVTAHNTSTQQKRISAILRRISEGNEKTDSTTTRWCAPAKDSNLYESGGSEASGSDSAFNFLAEYESDGPIVCYRVIAPRTTRSEQELDVQPGELVVVTDDPAAQVLWGQRCADPTTHGAVARCLLAAPTELEKQTWVCGNMGREAAEALLTKPPVRPGTFLVRWSDTKSCYVISYTSRSSEQGEADVEVRHVVCHAEGGRYRCWGELFPDMMTLIKHYTESRDQKLTTPYDKYLPCSLSGPTSKPALQPPASVGRSVPFTASIQQLNSTSAHSNQTQAGARPEIIAGTTPGVNRDNSTNKPVRNPNSIKRPVDKPPPCPPRENSFFGVAPTSPQTNSKPQPPSKPPLTSSLAPKPQPRTSLTYSAASANFTHPWGSGQAGGNKPIFANRPLPKPPSDPAVEATDPSLAPSLGKDKDWLIESKAVSRLEKIGAGHYGEVWMAKMKKTNKIVALKTFNRDRMREDCIVKEVKSMMTLRHPNLVEFQGYCADPDDFFMLLEFHSRGSVLDYLRKGMTLNVNEKESIMLGVLAGMQYLQEEGFVHRDLAARNVLLTDRNKPKIADFGLAQMIKADGKAQNDNQKTPWKWTAPEAICGRNLWTDKCDVWSFGVFCWELYSNCQTQPYPEIRTSSSLLNHLEAGFRLSRPLECSEATYRVMQECWQFDHNRRVSFAGLWKFFQN